jgi:hypothetical protein
MVTRLGPVVNDDPFGPLAGNVNVSLLLDKVPDPVNVTLSVPVLTT